MTGAKRDKIRVVIAEDQAMVLGALAALLEMEDDIEVVARARNGEEALRTVQELRPEVFITDIEMPKLTGLEVAAELKRRGVPVRIIILTTFARAGYLAARARGGRFRISAERHACRTTGRRRAPGTPRPARHRSATGG